MVVGNPEFTVVRLAIPASLSLEGEVGAVRAVVARPVAVAVSLAGQQVGGKPPLGPTAVAETPIIRKEDTRAQERDAPHFSAEARAADTLAMGAAVAGAANSVGGREFRGVRRWRR